jgi:hypothetical protein
MSPKFNNVKNISSNKNYIDLIILNNIMKKYNDIFYVYKFNNNKNIVNINRKKPSMCDICNVIHDNENAYLIFGKNNVSIGCYRSNNNIIKQVYIKEPIKTPLIENNNIDNQIFNKLLLVTLELRNKLNKKINYNIDNKKLIIEKKKKKIIVSPKNNGYVLRTCSSFDRYFKLGKDIINKKDSLINLVKQFCNEKNIYKVKQKSLRVVKYLEVLKENNINNISTTLKNIFNMKKIEFFNYIKNIPLNIKDGDIFK